MMEFVHNNHVIIGRIHLFPEFETIQCLHRNKEMFCPLRLIFTYCQIPKLRVL